MESGLGLFKKYYVHSKNTHIKLNPDLACRAGICRLAYHLIMGWNGQKSETGPLRAVYPSGWGYLILGDVKTPESWQEALKSCSAVCHCAASWGDEANTDAKLLDWLLPQLCGKTLVYLTPLPGG